MTRVGSSRSKTRLSILKSLWITQLRDVVGLVLVEPRHHPLEVRRVVGVRVAVARRPALDLPADVAQPLAERPQPGGLGVDRVQLDEDVDHVQAQPRGLLRRQRVRRTGRRAGRRRRAAP